MALVQKWSFFQLLFLGKIGQENVFYDILQRKNAFLGYKNKKFKYSKNWPFFRGVNSRFWSKTGLFPTVFFRQYRPGKCLLRYSRTINVFLGYKNKKLKKSKNWLFSEGVNAWFWSKNGHFPNFFLGNIGQENVLYYILEQKNTFLGYKNNNFK